MRRFEHGIFLNSLQGWYRKENGRSNGRPFRRCIIIWRMIKIERDGYPFFWYSITAWKKIKTENDEYPSFDSKKTCHCKTVEHLNSHSSKRNIVTATILPLHGQHKIEEKEKGILLSSPWRNGIAERLIIPARCLPPYEITIAEKSIKTVTGKKPGFASK